MEHGRFQHYLDSLRRLSREGRKQKGNEQVVSIILTMEKLVLFSIGSKVLLACQVITKIFDQEAAY